MIAVGDVVALAVEKPAAGGRMIARLDGQILLVSGAIPGERVTAVVERVGKGVAYAATVSIEERSPDRRECAGDPRCGGCLYAAIAYARQLELKAAVVADAFARIARMPLPTAVTVTPSPEDGYRMRARVHARGSRLGFFVEGSHDICGVRQTRQLLPETCDALDRLSASLRTFDSGVQGEIELSENMDASERVIQIDGATVLNDALVEHLLATGVHPTAVVVGPTPSGRFDGFSGLLAGNVVRGDPCVTDRFTVRDKAVALRRHVASFFQGNRFLLPVLAEYVASQVPEGGEVTELYAGVGLFSVTAATVRGAHVTAVEGDRSAAADLVFNAANAQGGVRPIHGAVETFLQTPRSRRGQVAQTLVVDPPRTGLSREAALGIIAMRASRIVYVSCDVATLARDARRLVDARYQLSGVTAFDMFPNTPHVEVVCVFER